VNEKFLKLGTFIAKNGENVRFWEDRWLENFTLQNRFTSLYCIARRKNDFVASIMSSTPLNVSFKRGLQGRKLALKNAHLERFILPLAWQP
jgi:hypothetical protein